MTTIAVRGGIMACDSAWSDDSMLVAQQTKIVRTKHDILIGSAGDCSERDLLKRLQRVKRPADIPSIAELMKHTQEKSDFTLVLYFPDRTIWEIQKSEDSIVEVLPIHSEFYAIGSGRQAAMVAMGTFGSDAAKAVEVACDYDINSRPPIHIVEHYLQKPVKKRRNRQK